MPHGLRCAPIKFIHLIRDRLHVGWLWRVVSSGEAEIGRCRAAHGACAAARAVLIPLQMSHVPRSRLGDGVACGHAWMKADIFFLLQSGVFPFFVGRDARCGGKDCRDVAKGRRTLSTGARQGGGDSFHRAGDNLTPPMFQLAVKGQGWVVSQVIRDRVPGSRCGSDD